MKLIKVISIFILSFATFYLAYNLVYTNNKAICPYLKHKNDIDKTYRIGFCNITKESTFSKLKIKGKIPNWLNGTLLRTGPAKFYTDKSWISNWFDGLSMIYGFKFNNGSVTYTNKFLYSDNYKVINNTKIFDFQGYLSNGPLNLFSKFIRILSPEYFVYHPMPNANVNISMIDKHPVALTEIPYPVQFDLENLQTLGPLIYNDNLPQDFIQTTAHPHYDFKNKEQIGYFIKFGKTSSYNIYKIKDGDTKREIISTIPTNSPSYMHSFSITKRYAILIAIPFVANIWKLLLGNYGYLKNFNWSPELKTSFIVVDRINNKVIGQYKTEPFFMFHTVNAFEKNNKLTIDLINYNNPNILDHAYLNKLLSKQKYHYIDKSIQPKLTRFTINLDQKESNKVQKQLLSEELVEFPQINYKNYNTKDYRYVYTCSKDYYSNSPIYCLENLLKIDVKKNIHKKWHCKNCYPGEPIFVPNPKADKEDNGVILSLVLDTSKNKSFLLILDAKSFTEIARAELDYYIPFCIHGLFIKKEAIDI